MFHSITQAKNLFLQGIENEQSGQLYEAIQFYRRAVQLVPDIEFRLYESTKPKLREKMEIVEKKVDQDKSNDNQESYLEDLEVEDDDCDILGKLSRIIEKNGYICLPDSEQSVGMLFH